MITVRLYQELNDFLPPDMRHRDVVRPLAPGATVKTVVEDMGVPHKDIDLVLLNGRSVSLDRRLRLGDRLSVYPVFESLDISAVSRVRPQPLRRTAFVADVRLEGLACLLRVLGFDTVCGDHEVLAEIATAERRIILTPDRGLLERRSVTRGYLVRSAEPISQAADVVRRFSLRPRPFTRCARCNAVRLPRRPVRLRSLIRDRRVRHCAQCGRLHGKPLRRTVRRILRVAGGRS